MERENENYGITTQNNKINEALGDKYNFESMAFHESVHRSDPSTHDGTTGEVETILQQTQHASWEKTPLSFKQAQASYAVTSLKLVSGKVNAGDYVNRLNKSFSGIATFYFENKELGVVFELPEINVPLK